MVQTPQQKAAMRAKKALRDGKIFFQPRGEANKALFENMKDEFDKKAKEINSHTSSEADRILQKMNPVVALFSGCDSTNPQDRVNARLLQNAANNKANKADRELVREQKAAAKAKAKAKGRVKARANADEPSAKRAKTSSSSSAYSSYSSSSDHAEDHSPTVEEVKNEEDVADDKEIVEGVEIMPPPSQDGQGTTDSDLPVASTTAESLAPSKAEDGEADKAENLPLASKNDPFMSEWTKEILHYWHPRAAVEWSEYVRKTCNPRRPELLTAILRVAKMLTALEGKDIEFCKDDLDRSQKFGADMNWARHFSLKFPDTEHAITIHEYDSFTPLLCTVRLNKSSV
jgi:hypothetical protein